MYNPLSASPRKWSDTRYFQVCLQSRCVYRPLMQTHNGGKKYGSWILFLIFWIHLKNAAWLLKVLNTSWSINNASTNQCAGFSMIKAPVMKNQKRLDLDFFQEEISYKHLENNGICIQYWLVLLLFCITKIADFDQICWKYNTKLNQLNQFTSINIV